MTVQRYKFISRVRQPEESVAKFVATLRHLAIHCGYGDSLNDMLRDRLICGINDARIQRRLLAETKVDFKRAMKIAQAMETADRDATHLQCSQIASYPGPGYEARFAKRVASYPGPEKGPGIYCLRMRRHPTFLWGIGNYSNLVRVS